MKLSWGDNSFAPPPPDMLAGPMSAAEQRLIGDSVAMAEVRRIADSIAARESTIMILGETGAGKEMLASYVHRRSKRAAKPFIPVDCSSLADTLFESELFGHIKGAYTGATRDSLGFIRSAEGGTLFLDEIGELSLPLQSKLLRVLQERVVTPVGSTKPIPVDIRVLCATNRSLEEMVRTGDFRQDLYFRLNVVTLRLPPLRERQDDILPLCRHFLNVQAKLYHEPLRQISDESADALRTYPWPGNVRELANVMEHAHVLAAGDLIEVSDLPPRIGEGGNAADMLVENDVNLVDVERQTIAKALKRADSNKAAAARMLGLNIQRLNRRIAKLNIQCPQ